MVTRGEHPGFVCWNSRFRGVFRELSRVKVRSRCSRFLKKYHPRNFKHVRSSHLSGTGLPGRKNIVPRTILLPGPARCGLRVFCYGFRCRNLSAPSTRYFFFFFLAMRTVWENWDFENGFRKVNGISASTPRIVRLGPYQLMRRRDSERPKTERDWPDNSIDLVSKFTRQHVINANTWYEFRRPPTTTDDKIS